MPRTTDAPPHVCSAPTCGICGEPEELQRLRQIRVRPVLELNAGPDVVMAKLVMDELRPLLLATLRIKQQAEEWSASRVPAIAEAGAQIIRQFTGTDWEQPVPARQMHLPTITEESDDMDDDDILHAPPQIVRPAPAELPRRFHIVRTVDVTDISGVGIIGEGVQVSDGAVAFRWLGGPPQDEPAWQVYDNKTTKPFVKISGHNGNTKIVWLDPPPPDADRSP